MYRSLCLRLEIRTCVVFWVLAFLGVGRLRGRRGSGSCFVAFQIPFVNGICALSERNFCPLTMVIWPCAPIFKVIALESD